MGSLYCGKSLVKQEVKKLDIENIKRRGPQSVRKVNINIKVSQAASNWLKEKDYSPTGIFHECLKDLGFVEPEEMAADLKEIEDPAPDRDIDVETDQIEAIEQELHPESQDAEPETSTY